MSLESLHQYQEMLKVKFSDIYNAEDSKECEEALEDMIHFCKRYKKFCKQFRDTDGSFE